jgi:hypothetical protein
VSEGIFHDAYIQQRSNYHQKQRADLSGPLQPCPTCSLPMPKAGLPCPPPTLKPRRNRQCGGCKTVWSEISSAPSAYQGICPVCEDSKYSGIHEKWAQRDSPHPLYGKVPT